MNRKPYPEYKDSGVPWLGELPEHWEVKKLKNLFRCFGGGTPSKSNAAFWEGDIPWVSPKDMHGKTISDTEDHISENAIVESATQIVPTGSTLIVVRSGILKHTLPVATNLIPVALNQDMKALVSNGAMKNVYLTYYIQGHNKSLLDAWTKNGCTVESVESASMLGALVPVPPLPEQSAIADFLDRETGRIDTLVVKKRRLVELLKEKRTALISRTVTRGLPEAAARKFGFEPHTRFKDSGIEWLGEVPEGWQTPPLYARYSVELGKMLNESRITGNHLISYLRNVDVQWDSINFDDLPEMDISESEYQRYTLQKGDLLVCEGGEVGRAAIVGEMSSLIGYQKALHRMRTIRSAEVARFMFYTLFWATKTGVFNAGGTSTIAHLTGEQLRKYRFPTPPLSEQTAIAAYLDRETSKIDQLVAKVEAVIVRLQEYRTALITAAVTGKIDVRAYRHAGGACPRPRSGNGSPEEVASVLA